MATPGIADDISVPQSGTSSRTLIVGLDKTGRVLQHDRAAGEILAGPGGSLIGAELASLITRSASPGCLQALIDSACDDREGQAVLTVRTASGQHTDAVVTVQPVRSTDARLVAQAILRIAPSSEQRFLDPGVMRQALLDGAFSGASEALDLERIAPALVNILVPHFCNSAAVLVLERLVGDEGIPLNDGVPVLRRLAMAHDKESAPGWDAAFPTGELLSYPPGTPYNRCLETGQPVLTQYTAELAEKLATEWRRRPVARLLADASNLVLPLIAGDTQLGFFVCSRLTGYRRFDAYDIEMGMDFAGRAATFIDNARRYSKQAATAITLQRSLLPRGLTAPSSVEVRHRYLPGSKMIEVGGDWYESIALPGGRVALVVGDVAGHGVRAAVTMGRLRTAIRTLARLELPPADALQQLDDLMIDLGRTEPHFATCVYAVYDAVSGTCEVASAGHLPPLLVSPGSDGEFLDVAPAPPLGIGSGPMQTRTFKIRDGSLLVLYTDGLVERRTADIDEGLTRLRETFTPDSVTRPLEDLCKATLAGVYADEQRDDIAVLLARLRRLAPDQHVTWKLAAELTSARRARLLVRRRLRSWGLDELTDVAELLASELVTNAVRYAHGAIALRLVREGGLVCEVLDDSAALPRLRHAGDDDERGRGLQVVSQLAHRWGARRTQSGKVVWCELPLPRTP